MRLVFIPGVFRYMNPSISTEGQYKRQVLDSEVRLPGFKSTVRLWANFLTSVNISFLICTIRIYLLSKHLLSAIMFLTRGMVTSTEKLWSS